VAHGGQGRIAGRRVRRLRDPEVDDLGVGSALVLGHQDVRRLDVAVDDPLLMGVLHRAAHLDEELKPVRHRKIALVAVLRDRHAAHELHDEVRPAARVAPASKHARDPRMVHHRERLPLGVEPRDDLARVHPQLDDLERDLAADRLVLLGEEDGAEPALPEDPGER
jgi:hypothetical protein